MTIINFHSNNKVIFRPGCGPFGYNMFGCGPLGFNPFGFGFYPQCHFNSCFTNPGKAFAAGAGIGLGFAAGAALINGIARWCA